MCTYFQEQATQRIEHLRRVELRCTVGHHALEISDGTFGNVELTILTQTLTTEDVTARLNSEALGARLGGEADRTRV